MKQVIEVKFKKDKSKTPFSTYSKFKSQDVNSVEFHLAFDGVELNESHKVVVHCKFKKSDSVLTEVADVAEGKAIFKFDARYITQKEEVHCSVYVSKGDQSIDVRTFIFEVELSEIDKGSLRVAGVYDANYQKLLEDFETGGQSAISQFEISANNKTSSKLSEIDTKGNKAIADFEQTADESLDVKLGEIQSVADGAVEQFIRDGDAEIGNFNQRGDAEIADWREGADSELEEYLADKVDLLNILDNGDFSSGTTGWGVTRGNLQAGSGTVFFTPTDIASRIGRQNDVNINHVYYHAMRAKATGSTPSIYPTNPLVATQAIKGTGEWEMASVIHKPTVSSTEIRYVYNGAIGVPIEVDWIIRIDLTQTFGAGNEPTKSEMDELIKITGYFDEITLTNKQLLNWQLKLMRQNRNAVVALGGTII